ncbi:MAG TPA: hypothetical protein VFV57_08950 [Limnobacter sp.]|nr:hypothetical protein [Limnobacter sp.]
MSIAMPLLRSVLLTLLVVAAPVWAQPRLPTLQAQDLNEKTYTLPTDLPGPHTLVLVAFKREQQALVDTWINGLQLKNPNSAYHWIELPVLENYGGWFQWFVDNGMRRGIQGQYNREKVITVYTNKETFRQSTGIANEDTIHLLVTTPKGEIVTHLQGAYSADKAQVLTPFKRVMPGK